MFRLWENKSEVGTYQAQVVRNENSHHDSDSDSDSDFNYLESTDGEDTRIDSGSGGSKKKRLHLNEPAKQICLNIYNNLLKEKEADSEAGAMSETVLKLAARLTGIPMHTPPW
jgi:hypothetical protein